MNDPNNDPGKVFMDEVIRRIDGLIQAVPDQMGFMIHRKQTRIVPGVYFYIPTMIIETYRRFAVGGIEVLFYSIFEPYGDFYVHTPTGIVILPNHCDSFVLSIQDWPAYPECRIEIKTGDFGEVGEGIPINIDFEPLSVKVR